MIRSYIQYKHYVRQLLVINVNLRDAPSLNGNVISQLHHGDRIEYGVSKMDGFARDKSMGILRFKLYSV